MITKMKKCGRRGKVQLQQATRFVLSLELREESVSQFWLFHFIFDVKIPVTEKNTLKNTSRKENNRLFHFFFC